METMNYFQHDYRSRLDKKLLKIRRKHGMSGFGVYWALVEMLHEGSGFIEMDVETIAYELQCDEEIIKDVIELCFEYFEGNVTCNRVIENLEFRREKASEKSKQATAAVNKRWEKYRNSIQKPTDSIQPVYEQNTDELLNHTIEIEKEIEKDIDKDNNIAVKQLDKLTEYIDDNNIPAAKKLLADIIDDYGSFDNILKICYGDDTAILNNWKKYFSNTLQIINQ
jgi:hypothetical protein